VDFDLNALRQRDRYKLLTALVVPRPIAWVTTRNADASVNAAPFSFFNVMGAAPPVVAFGPDDGPGIKDTPHNIRKTGRFVVNLVDEAVAAAMHASSGAYPRGVSEIDALGLALADMPWGDVPRIADAPAALACREHSTILIGRTRVVLGVVEGLYVRDGLVDAERFHVDQDALHAVGRLGGGRYTRTDAFELGPRPSAAEVGERRPDPG